MPRVPTAGISMSLSQCVYSSGNSATCTQLLSSSTATIHGLSLHSPSGTKASELSHTSELESSSCLQYQPTSAERDWNSVCKSSGRRSSLKDRFPGVTTQQAGPLLGSLSPMEGRCPSCTLHFFNTEMVATHPTCTPHLCAKTQPPTILLQAMAVCFPCLGLTKATGMAKRTNSQVR